MKKLFLLALTLSYVLLTGLNEYAIAQQRSTASQSAQKVDIYLAGSIYSNEKGTAGYLKNGVPVVLGKFNENSEVSVIAVVGNDVYAAGRDGAQVVYWKNGQKFTLTPDGVYGHANGITVYKGDVYVVGNENILMPGSRVFEKARLWKNGVSVPLSISEGREDSIGQCIAIDPKTGDVYVAGMDANKVTFWKNGAIMSLVNENYNIFPFDIAIANNDLYIAGWDRNGGPKQPAYVIGSKGKILLSGNGNFEGKIFSMAISGTDVYLAGYENDKAKYWKNNVAFELGSVTNYPDPSSIAVAGNDVYVAGLTLDGPNTGSFRYWKNGILQEKIKDFVIYDIAVVSTGNGNAAVNTPVVKKTQPAVVAKTSPIQLAALTPKQATEKFLAENKNKPGVITTPSGLQYEVLKNGSGSKPGSNDWVKVNYHGTLITGEVFDSTINRGTPVTMSLSNALPGIKEGVQLMPVGSKYKLVIPPDQGFGKTGAGAVKPDATLIIEIELLDIIK